MDILRKQQQQAKVFFSLPYFKCVAAWIISVVVFIWRILPSTISSFFIFSSVETRNSRGEELFQLSRSSPHGSVQQLSQFFLSRSMKLRTKHTQNCWWFTAVFLRCFFFFLYPSLTTTQKSSSSVHVSRVRRTKDAYREWEQRKKSSAFVGQVCLCFKLLLLRFLSENNNNTEYV